MMRILRIAGIAAAANTVACGAGRPVANVWTGESARNVPIWTGVDSPSWEGGDEHRSEAPTAQRKERGER
jgi:hypothetical protein